MENCGQESGAWIVLKSTDVNDEPMFALGHRRGGVVHYFISSHGQTLRGKDQAHKEDLETVEGIMAPRPCPKILNDVTLAQPKIDSNNRYRQEILAIEESLRTDSFPMRFLTTIWGMEFVDAFRLNKYFNKDPRPFKSQMKELAHKMLTNEWDEYHGLDGVSLTRRGLAITIGPGAPGGRSPQRTSPRQLAKKQFSSPSRPLRAGRARRASSRARSARIRPRCAASSAPPRMASWRSASRSTSTADAPSPSSASSTTALPLTLRAWPSRARPARSACARSTLMRAATDGCGRMMAQP